MNENIDLTKILKDCPKGTKFYSTVLGEIKFIWIINSLVYPIIVSCNDGNIEGFTADGKLRIEYDGDCVLFPSKDQRDWSKFTAPWYNKPIEQKFQVGQYITDGHYSGQIIEVDCHCYKISDFTGDNITIIPFTLQDNYHLWNIKYAKDGDVLVDEDNNIGIFKKCEDTYWHSYIYLGCDGKLKGFSIGGIHKQTDTNPTTKEQRDALMKAMNDAGYGWDIEKKELKKLVSNRFDPKTLKEFDKVIVRNVQSRTWHIEYFSHIEDRCKLYPFFCLIYNYSYCIPYNDDTKHLVGTTEEAPEYYRYWED